MSRIAKMTTEQRLKKVVEYNSMLRAGFKPKYSASILDVPASTLRGWFKRWLAVGPDKFDVRTLTLQQRYELVEWAYIGVRHFDLDGPLNMQTVCKTEGLQPHQIKGFKDQLVLIIAKYIRGYTFRRIAKEQGAGMKLTARQIRESIQGDSWSDPIRQALIGGIIKDPITGLYNNVRDGKYGTKWISKVERDDLKRRRKDFQERLQLEREERLSDDIRKKALLEDEENQRRLLERPDETDEFVVDGRTSSQKAADDSALEAKLNHDQPVPAWDPEHFPKPSNGVQSHPLEEIDALRRELVNMSHRLGEVRKKVEAILKRKAPQTLREEPWYKGRYE